MSITKKTAIEAVSISFTNAKDSIKQSEPQKAEKYSDAAPGPLRSTRISSLRYQRSRVKPTKTSLKFNPVSPFLVKTARLQAGRGKFKAIKKFFGICCDELDPPQARPSAIFARPKANSRVAERHAQSCAICCPKIGTRAEAALLMRTY